MRAEAMKYIMEHRDYFRNSLGKFLNVEAYCKHFGEPTIYGGHNEIIALCKLYKLEYIFHQRDVKPYTEEINGPSKHFNVVNLCYHKDQKHYNSVVPIISEELKTNEKVIDLLDTDLNPAKEKSIGLSSPDEYNNLNDCESTQIEVKETIDSNDKIIT